MSLTKNQARTEVARLVQRFLSRDRKAYSETQVKAEFIDAFFAILGWQVNESTFEYERKADYVFGAMLFVEAKACHTVSIESAITHQLQTYSYQTLQPVGVLTNFSELAVYDCSQSPASTTGDKRVLYLRAEEYVDRFDDIWNTLSKESLQNTVSGEQDFSKSKVSFRNASF